MTEVHDCFSITELVTMEDLGLSDDGGAVRDVLDGCHDADGVTLPDRRWAEAFRAPDRRQWHPHAVRDGAVAAGPRRAAAVEEPEHRPDAQPGRTAVAERLLDQHRRSGGRMSARVDALVIGATVAGECARPSSKPLPLARACARNGSSMPLGSTSTRSPATSWPGSAPTCWRLTRSWPRSAGRHRGRPPTGVGVRGRCDHRQLGPAGDAATRAGAGPGAVAGAGGVGRLGGAARCRRQRTGVGRCRPGGDRRPGATSAR